MSRYTQNQGLSSYNIHSIVQDPLGFTWVATQDGLNLFDGITFTKYIENGEKTKRLFGSDIRWLTVDTLRHMIWVLNPEVVINAVNYETGEVVKTIKGTRNNNDDWAVCMTLYNNRLWLSCMNGIKIYNIDKETWEAGPVIPFKKDRNDDLFSIRNIYADKNGLIWAFVNHYGILIIDGKTKAVVKIIKNEDLVPESQASQLNFSSVVNLRSGEILVGTSLGLKTILYDSRLAFKLDKQLKTPLTPLINSRIDAIAKTGRLIYIAGNGNLYKLNDSLSTCTKIKESNINDKETWLNEINSLSIDHTGNLWIGCKQGLAFLSSVPSAFKGFNNTSYRHSGLTHLYSLYPGSKGIILIGQEKSLIKYDSVTNKFLSINNSNSFNFSFTDFMSRIIISADDGLFVLTPHGLKNVINYYPELKPISDCYINSVVHLGDSLYAIGSDNDRGVFLWNYKRKTLRIINNNSSPIRLRSNIVKKVFTDSAGRIWVLSAFGIDIIEKDLSKATYINIKNPLSGNLLQFYFDICEVGGKFWLANYSFGIVEIDANGKVLKTLTVNNGLCDDGVYKIFPSGNNLFITTNNGLSVYDLQKSTFTNYYEKDGLHSNSFEENCGIQRNGNIYVGGLNGFTIINPKLLFVNNIAPRLYFTNIKTDRKSGSSAVKNLGITKLTIPEDALQTSVSFIGLNFGNSDRVQYKYKIEELNDKWIDLGTQNFVNFIGINPGNYTLQVESSNENGVWNKKPIKLLMFFLPKWYQTWSFKIALVVLGVVIVSSIYQYRINQIKVQQQIRREIANDLHDDLGSTLNSIKIFTHLAIEKKQNASYLSEIEKLITGMTAGLRDMLWVLEDSHDDVTALMERIKNFTFPIANASQVNLECAVEAGLENQRLSKTEKRNLLLIAKEAINNSFKYADCRTITVAVKTGINNKFSLFISDDGKGFDIADKSLGYGLNNMKYRAEQINFKVNIFSTKGNGTFITVEKK